MEIPRPALTRAALGSFDRRIYILAFGRLVGASGFAMVIPFLSIYFHQELGISLSYIGLYFGFTAILRATPQPFAGWLSDRLGRVPIMGWSLIIRSVIFAAVSFAIWKGAGFFTIAGIISVNYITGAVLHPAANAMVADLVDKEQRIPAYSLMRIAGNLGWAIGPALGGFIAHESYAMMFLVAGAIALIAGIYFLVMLTDSPRSTANQNPHFKLSDIFNLRRDKQLYQHCVISFVLFLMIAQLVAALSLYSSEYIGITHAQLGVLYAINGLMVVLLQYPVSIYFKKIPLTSQLALGAGLYAIGYLAVGLAPNYEFLIACMVVITLAEMIVSPPAVTLVANLSSPTTYGRYMGLFGFFEMLGWSLGPTVGGVLLDLFAVNPIIMWMLISFLGITACGLYLLYGRRLTTEINSGFKAAERMA